MGSDYKSITYSHCDQAAQREKENKVETKGLRKGLSIRAEIPASPLLDEQSKNRWKHGKMHALSAERLTLGDNLRGNVQSDSSGEQASI